ncbi:hypothetical protein BDZ94DRAFT_72466 [Collybia nuda]|uniref:Uncharacterized protein n=1 Tax=Collybia nuda TaxID=64659 RepID=A0A9P5XXY3_9AGAR|nr:hypothetical protein BDZ94DRAFT_72466 [Collybia nuda]
MDRPGIAYNDTNGNTMYLPLEQVRVNAVIVDISAKITLIQLYGNPYNITTARCKYCFPVPANGALCAFSMRTSDGRNITGVVKAKDQATVEFEEAVRTGKFTGLVEYVTDDIFTIAIGSISPQTTVEVKLVYVMTLANNDNIDEIRFQIPMAIGERYGTPPLELASSEAPGTNTRVKFKIQIQTSGRIQGITSPSHPGAISETRYPTDLGRLSRRRSTINFRPRSFLDRDFVLIIHAEGLDLPRCFAELHRDPECREPDTIAMELTIVPKFNLPPIGSQEYIFVIDRSGSMTGERINMAKQTIDILLHMLPVKGTLFNIFSFGSHVDGLWMQSGTYSQKNLDLATKHVNTMEADYGGTEICKAVEHVLSSCTTSMPSAIFILTDGEAHDVDETCRVVQLAVQGAPTGGPLRVFTLGIGNTVSSAMCEGIARAGNGVCIFAIDSESILGKCARLFRAGRTPFLKNVTVDWGIPAEYLSQPLAVNYSHHPSTPTGMAGQLPAIQQVPTHINDIHAGHRVKISAILSLRKSRVPKAVTLRGELDEGEAFNLAVPIMAIQLRDGGPTSLPWVHTLVAWQLIQDYEKNTAPLPQATAISEITTHKATIIYLGEKYQLASQHTSFVAIDEGLEDSRSSRATMPENFPHSRSPSPGVWDGEGAGENIISRNSALHNLHSGLHSIFQALVAGISGFGLNNILDLGQKVPGIMPGSSLASHLSSGDGDDSDSYESARTFSTLSSLEESDGWSNWSLPASPHLGPQIIPDEPERTHGSSPQVVTARLAPEEARLLLPRKPLPTFPPLPSPITPEITNLLKLQTFDGSFTLRELRNVVGNEAVEANNLNVDDKVWATALLVAFVRKQMGKQKELLGDLTIKAMEFLQANCLGVLEVLRRAEAALA